MISISNFQTMRDALAGVMAPHATKKHFPPNAHMYPFNTHDRHMYQVHEVMLMRACSFGQHVKAPFSDLRM